MTAPSPSERIRVNVFADGGAGGGGRAVVALRGSSVADLFSKIAEKFAPQRPVQAFLGTVSGGADRTKELAPADATLFSLGVCHDSVVFAVFGSPDGSTDALPTVSAVAAAAAAAAAAEPKPAATETETKEAENPKPKPAAAPFRCEATREGFSMRARLESLVSDAANVESLHTLEVALDTPPPKERKTLLVLLADQSASMRRSWHQVQQALLYIIGESFGQEDSLAVEVVLFQTTAKRLAYTRANFETVVMSETAHGQTCFASAFDMCMQAVAEHVRRTPALDVIIGLMTDGGHSTQRNALASYNALRQYLSSLRDASVVVHTIGFTDGHRFETLDRIRRELGKGEGTYQYADPSDGRTALRRKLEGIFDVASVFGGKLVAELTLSNFVFPPPASSLDVVARQVLTTPVVLDREGKASISVPVRSTSSSFVPTADTFAALNVNLRSEAGATICELACQTEMDITTGAVATVLLALRRMNSVVDGLHSRITSHTETPPTEVSAQYIKSLGQVQEDLKKLDDRTLFSLPRAYRGAALELRAGLHQRIAQMLDVLAHFGRGVFSSATKARLADLAFGGSFKTNRQRRVDRRVARNAMLLKDDAQRLEGLVIHEEHLRGASDASLELFNCVMSLATWVELTMEKDVCGFGVAVSRPEWIIDDPTQMRVLAISNTCLSKSSMEHALRCAIDLHGHMGATGGFGLNTEMGVAVRGRGREPINSWLPLYINEQHWSVVRILLRQILGYYVALDPLAFSRDQVDALVLTLGTMAARLSTGCGEHALKLMLQFQRTCLAVAREFDFLPVMEERLKRFIVMSPYETRDQIKNLVVAAAYLLILPADAIDRIFPTDTEWVRFWSTLIAVAVRRSAFSIFNDADDRVVSGFLDCLLYGKQHLGQGSKSPAAESMDAAQFLKTITDLAAADHDQEDAFEDLLMQSPSADEEETAESHPERPTAFSSAVVNRFVQQMARRGYPTVHAVHALLVYTLFWTKAHKAFASANKRHLAETLDDTWGIASDELISAIKKAFSETRISGTIGSFYDTLFGSTAEPGRWSSEYRCDLARATVGMGVRWRVNKQSLAAIDSGLVMDPVTDPLRCIVQLHEELRNERVRAVRAVRQSRAMVAEAAQAMASDEVLPFIEWIQRTMGPRRFSHKFREILVVAGSRRQGSQAHAMKLCVLFTGRYYETRGGLVVVVRVFDGSLLWLPGRRTKHLLNEADVDIAAMKALAESFLVDHGLLPSK